MLLLVVLEVFMLFGLLVLKLMLPLAAVSWAAASWAAVAARALIFCLPHIPTSLLIFGGVACRTLFASGANTPKSWWEGNSLFLAEGN